MVHDLRVALKNLVRPTDVVLITGGNGFIGSHVAHALHDLGLTVRIANNSPASAFSRPISSQLAVGNLCDLKFCQRVVHGARFVFHFAATMGGMGTIHAANDFPIYTQNHTMTLNVLRAAIEAGVQRFFYASSACVYSESTQAVDNIDSRLAEVDVWAALPPCPQGLYGLDKLNSELVLHHFRDKIEVRIARFHNVYGPRGTWRNGHEKAPAALLRKAVALQAQLEVGATQALSNSTLEIWGDGSQRRSFLFIEDCIEAVLRLFVSDHDEPINIGSEEAVSVKGLAEIALGAAGVDPGLVQFQYDASKPVGVAARNSSNAMVQRTLGWSPSTSLDDGMLKTAAWLKGEVKNALASLGSAERLLGLQKLQRSDVVDLSKGVPVFAILLPITSRGSDAPDLCLKRLSTFSRSLARTTWRDTHPLTDIQFAVRVYLAIDKDDGFLLPSFDYNPAEATLRDEGICDVRTLVCDHPRGHVCALWRSCARRAWEEDCSYFVLMGDDVVLQDEGWMRDTHAAFASLALKEGVPEGFGCVAFTDTSFRGMPTFPVMHRTHMDIFGGEVVPEVFVNQDADPYLFQLYRRWGCSTVIDARLRNEIGGSVEARYEKQHAVGWTFDTLDAGVEAAGLWILERHPKLKRKLTLDVVVPCYRVQMFFLDQILALKPSPTCTVMFIIIVDDPSSPNITEVLDKYESRVDVRIRVNKRNMGASESRNRGMESESAADWVQFLDDDVHPRADLLVEAERVIRSHPCAAGFVGNAQFPVADTAFKTAIHLAGVTFFWDIATKWGSDVPWGVTANLIARRNEDGVKYKLCFPKTGGGEDIDFCLQKRKESMKKGGEGFFPAPDVVVTHPWWNGGLRSYWRFYGWSRGDGALVKLYPEHTYLDGAPNSGELLLALGAATILAAPLSFFAQDARFCVVPAAAALSNILANVAHDCYRHLWRDAVRTKSINSSVSGIRWLLAIVESAFIRMASEIGRTVGVLERGEVRQLGRRFDWFVGRGGDGPRREERINARQRLLVSEAILLAILYHYL